MKSIVLFTGLLLATTLSCKKETQYRSTSIQDTVIAPDTTMKNDTVIVHDTLRPGPDTVRYRKDTIVKIKN